MLKLAVPNKGRLSDGAVEILDRIGLKAGGDRRLYAEFGGKYTLMFVRATDIPEFVHKGIADLGITGRDIFMEWRLTQKINGKENRECIEVLPLNFGYCTLVVAVRENSEIFSVGDIPRNASVATTFPHLTSRFFEKKRVKVHVVTLSGATEVAPHMGVADVITDIMETGTTMKMNQLRVIDTILESRALILGNKRAMGDKRVKIREFLSVIKSVISAGEKRYVMANVPVNKLEEVRSLLPGISGPTVMSIMGGKNMVAVHAVCSVEDINGIITALKKLGATGILIIPIERLVE